MFILVIHSQKCVAELKSSSWSRFRWLRIELGDWSARLRCRFCWREISRNSTRWRRAFPPWGKWTVDRNLIRWCPQERKHGRSQCCPYQWTLSYPINHKTSWTVRTESEESPNLKPNPSGNFNLEGPEVKELSLTVRKLSLQAPKLNEVFPDKLAVRRKVYDENTSSSILVQPNIVPIKVLQGKVEQSWCHLSVFTCSLLKFNHKLIKTIPHICSVFIHR